MDRDLADSATEGLSPDWRLNIIQSLKETIGADAGTVSTLEMFRKKRNLTGYERVAVVSDADASAMRRLALRLRDEVLRWLREYHPQLLEPE